MIQIVKIHAKYFSKKAVVEMALEQAGISFTSINIYHREYEGLYSFVKTNEGDFTLYVRGTEGPMIFFEVTYT